MTLVKKPTFVHETVWFDRGGIMVWAGMSNKDRIDLWIIRNRAWFAQRCRGKILRSIVFLYAEAIDDEFILLNGNAKPHHVLLMDNFLFDERILWMDWSANFSDMHPIEHVCDLLGKRVNDRISHPQTIQKLKNSLLQEWERLS